VYVETFSLFVVYVYAQHVHVVLFAFSVRGGYVGNYDICCFHWLLVQESERERKNTVRVPYSDH
jgi:hypothetical protein